MSNVPLVQFTQEIVQQTLEDAAQNQQTAGKIKVVTENANAQQTNADTFVASTQNPANDAGTFQVQQVPLFSAAATVLLGQTANAPTLTAKPAIAAPAAQNIGPQNNPAINAPIANAAIVAPLAAPAPAPAAATAPATSSNAAATLSDLSNLNASLTVLGLSPSEIAVIDRVAELIKDFNANAYVDLISQFQSLAQSSAPQPAAATATPAATAAAPATNAAAKGNFTIQELSLKFNGINETANVSAFQLQISEATITLNNTATGQTAQVQAPQTPTAATLAPLKAAAAAA